MEARCHPQPSRIAPIFLPNCVTSEPRFLLPPPTAAITSGATHETTKVLFWKNLDAGDRFSAWKTKPRIVLGCPPVHHPRHGRCPVNPSLTISCYKRV